MITPAIARFAQERLQALHADSRRKLANDETMAGRALGVFGARRGADLHLTIPRTLVEPAHAGLFARIFVGLLSALAVAAIAFAFTLPSGTPDFAIRMAQAYFQAALRIFCFLVATFGVVDWLQRRGAHRDPIEKDV